MFFIIEYRRENFHVFAANLFTGAFCKIIGFTSGLDEKSDPCGAKYAPFGMRPEDFFLDLLKISEFML
jgi:hypothetical protein